MKVICKGHLFVESAWQLPLLNMYKNFENDVIARAIILSIQMVNCKVIAANMLFQT